ncbi:MAG: hypothetical protein IPN72_09430 [Saprospiraceae bacterium]|nr:hypothetical protein [Saprospiraceae bacterium]
MGEVDIDLLPSGEFNYGVEAAASNLSTNTTLHGANGTTQLKQVILQGHNTTVGVTYDIYWDDLSASPIAFDLTANTLPVEHLDTISFCDGTTLNFGLTGTNTDTYVLMFNGNSINTGTIGNVLPNIMASNSTTGNYELIVTNSNGCSLNLKFHLKVNPLPIATPTTTIQACSEVPYAFDLDNYITNNGSGLGQVTYSYTVVKVPNLPLLDPDPAGGPFTSLNGAISNTVTNFGTSAITVRYTVTPTSANGCVGTPFIVNVVINPNPQVDIIPNGSSNLCEGDSRIISGTVVPNATYTYLWSIITDPASMGNSTLTNPTSISPTLQVATSITPGPLTVEFTATNTATGCSATETFTFTVFDMPDITVVAPAVITACEMPAESEFGTFNLMSAVVTLTGGTPTFHISASDAQNGIGAINNPTMFSEQINKRFGYAQHLVFVMM